MSEVVQDLATYLRRRHGRTDSFSLPEPINDKEGEARPCSGRKTAIDSASTETQKSPAWDIREIPEHEDQDALYFPPWKRRFAQTWALTAFIGPFFALRAAYAQYYAGFQTTSPEGGNDDWSRSAQLLALILYMFSWIPSVPHILIEAYMGFGQWRKRLKLVGEAAPRVDIVITCCNEPDDVIQNTALAALALDYPERSFRVVISDDGASPVVAAWAARLGQGQGRPNLYYTARRSKPKISDYKAGNLNHALRFTAELPGGPAPFFAGLDADMIPERKWLRRVVPHLLLDPKMAMACAAQRFYNNPPNDPLGQDNMVAWTLNDWARDMCGAAWNSGTGYVARRRALEETGGFPPTISEDVYSAALMLAHGWRACYVGECLQYGLVPDSYLGNVKQRTRWNIGGLQMQNGMHWHLSQSKTKQMTLVQRLVGATTAFAGIIVHCMVFARFFLIPLYLIRGDSLLSSSSSSSTSSSSSSSTGNNNNNENDALGMMASEIRLQALSWLAIAAYNLHRGVISDYRAIIEHEAVVIHLTPYTIIALIRSFLLPLRLGGTAPGFTPTGSIADTHERDPLRREPFARRARHMLVACGVWFHATVLLVYILALAYRVYAIAIVSLASSSSSSPQGREEVLLIATELLGRVGWLLPTWLLTAAGLAVPIKYLVWPPDVRDREEVLAPAEVEGGPSLRAVADDEDDDT
ncbi:glycosyltransferase family 2 protein [Xylariomycetidae sp. FL2044]|nr:glycosyltransferase family 2 protein [Xylariomycetidae sp. FL2044]